MADSMQPKRLNINNNIDQSKTVLDSNETTSPGHLDIFSSYLLLQSLSFSWLTCLSILCLSYFQQSFTLHVSTLVWFSKLFLWLFHITFNKCKLSPP